jgi:hypothetical protein
VVNLTEADLTNNEGDTLVGDIGKHARDAETGTRHVLGTRSRS